MSLTAILSPAKSLDFESDFPQENFSEITFKKEVNNLIKKMQNFSAQDLQNLMKISPKLAQLNHERFQNFSEKFNQKNSRPALLAFDGDVYSKIEKSSFNQENFAFAQKNIRILSGLYGLLKAMDLIQPYRLEMGTKFNKFNLEINNLYQFWGNKITEKLNDEKIDFLINLASEEYFSAVNKEVFNGQIINIIFKETKNGQLKIIGMNAKRARGMMANFIIKEKIQNPEDLKKFNQENYSFKSDLSDDSNWVFAR